MKNLPVFITLFYFLFFLNHIIITVYSSTRRYIPVDDITLDCGSSTNQTALDGRKWIGDEQYSKFAHIQEQTNSTKSNYASTAKSQLSSVDEVPYKTARIFRSPFNYSFPVTPGPKFVRLYFYPAQYQDFDATKAYFQVNFGSFTLLKNFSANLVAQSLNQDAFVREFCVNVIEPNQRLNLSFLPSSTLSSSENDSYAFVNGIEIVSMPTNLYYGAEKGLYPPRFVGHDQFWEIINSFALETIWRLNLGGRTIPAMNDTGMYRRWSQNEFLMTWAFNPVNVTKPLKYTKISNYTAPDEVYQTAISMGNNSTENRLHNLTWRLPVDKKFNYLVRLHFCEFMEEITKVNDRRFGIYLANQTAESTFDVIEFGGNGIPIYRDYVVSIFQEDYLFIDLEVDNKYSRYVDASLNGIEVFKISNNGSLAGPNPEVPPGPNQANPASTTEKSKKKKKTLFIALGSAMGFLIILFCIVFCVVLWRLRKTKYYNNDSYKGKSYRSTKASSLPEELCRRFSLSEIKTATNDFDDDLVIGKGGFGNVYQGFIDEGSTVVAVKRLNPGSKQGAQEFVTEIEMLSQLRYLHLVSLIGYCDEDREMILVYEYVANGTLRDHLYGSDNDPLTWKQRLEICVGAARGLHYLHAGVKDTIIHRDVKTTNILLDENWVAKVSDFGLSKIGLSDTAVSTMVKGTFGYLDPEYARNQQLTEKSDVYSFGVVLFEVLCARKPLDIKLDEAQCNLAYWARRCIMDGTIQNIIDPFLMGKIAPECFKKFVDVAESCIRDQRVQRPTMADVMEKLEFALELQEQADTAKEGITPDGVYYYPEVSFRASDKSVARYDVSGLQSRTGLTSLDSDATGLSFLSVDTESKTGDMFSETTNSKSTE